MEIHVSNQSCLSVWITSFYLPMVVKTFKFISILGVMLSICEICYDWWCIVIVFNLIGDCIFLQSEPQKSIVCHQTFIQGLGMKLT